MDKFISLYDFVDFARANRKYPNNTANNLKSAIKIFEKELNAEELKSINMVEDSMGEIFRSLVIAHKDKSIVSLNTYKARLLKVINDYKKYGVDPGKMQGWVAKTKKDKPDNKKIILSKSINTHVENWHKIELSLRPDTKFILQLPNDMNAVEGNTIKAIIDSLVKRK